MKMEMEHKKRVQEFNKKIGENWQFISSKGDGD